MAAILSVVSAVLRNFGRSVGSRSRKEPAGPARSGSVRPQSWPGTGYAARGHLHASFHVAIFCPHGPDPTIGNAGDAGGRQNPIYRLGLATAAALALCH